MTTFCGAWAVAWPASAPRARRRAAQARRKSVGTDTVSGARAVVWAADYEANAGRPQSHVRRAARGIAGVGTLQSKLVLAGVGSEGRRQGTVRSCDGALKPVGQLVNSAQPALIERVNA